jgi:SAM-dependent methyltransferase
MSASGARPKQYDRAYFDRWYRDPKLRVATRVEVQRKAAMVIGLAEFLLQRPVKSLLDVGCGEAPWRAALKTLRPKARYTGVDPSDYVVERFGKARHIKQGTFGELAALKLRGPFDVIVVCDVLQYVPATELAAGAKTIAGLLGGVTYLEAYTTADEIEGDRRGWHERSPAEYRRVFGRAGLTGIGMQCWVGAGLRPMTTALERSTP